VDIVSDFQLLAYSIISLISSRNVLGLSLICGEVCMNKINKSYCSNSQDIATVLRDIIDVLYDGYCKVLNDDELCSTIRKKVRELQYRSRREKRYKLLKIFNILNTTQYSMNCNCKLNKEVVISILDEVYILCVEVLKQQE